MTNEQFPDIDIEDMVSLDSIINGCAKKGFEIIACALSWKDSQALQSALVERGAVDAQAIPVAVLADREVVFPKSAMVLFGNEVYGQASAHPEIQEKVDAITQAPRDQGQKLLLMAAPEGFVATDPKPRVMKP